MKLEIITEEDREKLHTKINTLPNNQWIKEEKL